MSRFWYTLDGHDPVAVDQDDPASMAAWGEWCFGPDAEPHRRVALDRVGQVSVSTVFAGYDMDVPLAEPPQPPLAFETMIIRGDDRETFGRWRTWVEALEQHAAALRMVLKEQPP